MNRCRLPVWTGLAVLCLSAPAAAQGFNAGLLNLYSYRQPVVTPLRGFVDGPNRYGDRQSEWDRRGGLVNTGDGYEVYGPPADWVTHPFAHRRNSTAYVYTTPNVYANFGRVTYGLGSYASEYGSSYYDPGFQKHPWCRHLHQDAECDGSCDACR